MNLSLNSYFSKAASSLLKVSAIAAIMVASVVVSAPVAQAVATNITPTEISDGRVGVAYSEVLTYSNYGACIGETPAGTVTWTVTGLPAGLTATPSSTGQTLTIAGTPTTAGTYTVVATANCSGATADGTFNDPVTIYGAADIITTALTPATINQPYSAAVTTANCVTPTYTAINAADLPTGITFNASTGTFSGTPTTAAVTETFDITVLCNAGTEAETTVTETVTLKVNPYINESPVLPTGIVNQNYSFQLTATNCSAPMTWTSTPLPAGLSLSPAGFISGVPQTANTAATDDVTFTVTCADGTTDTWMTSLPVVGAATITTTTVPEGTANVAYIATQLVAANCTDPETWTSSTLPNGLTLSPTGVLSGTPTTAGTYPVTVIVTCADGQIDTQDLTIVIKPGAKIANTALPVAYEGSAYYAQLVAENCTSPTNYRLDTGDVLPNGLSINSTTGEITGTTAVGATDQTVKFLVTCADGQTAQSADITIVTEVAPSFATCSAAKTANALVPLIRFTNMTTGEHYYNTVETATPTGFVKEGVLGYLSAAKTTDSNSFPIYLLMTASGDYMLSTEVETGTSAVRILGYTLPVSDADMLSEFYSTGNTDYLYTGGYDEAMNATAVGYDSTGFSIQVCDAPQEVPNYIAIHRLFNPTTGKHFMTTSPAEAQMAAQYGFKYEGVVATGYSTPGMNRVALFRLYNVQTATHLYTTSATEKANAMALGYRDEGISAYTLGNAISMFTTEFHRSRKAANVDYVYTTSAGEVASAINYGYRYEGVAANVLNVK